MARTVIGSARTLAGARTATSARNSVNTNLVPNAGFETAPTFVAAGGTQARWIDGSAAGSVAHTSAYKWGIRSITGTATAQFDNSTSHSGTYSMKLSTAAITSDIIVETDTATTILALSRGAIPILPNTVYQVTFWMKTNYASGDSSDGAHMLTQERSASGGATGTNATSTKVKTTTDWTQYSLNFTSAATSALLQLICRVRGNTGTATLVMDAWFDDIALTQTTSPSRTVA